jgi:hypothetical protein
MPMVRRLAQAGQPRLDAGLSFSGAVRQPATSPRVKEALGHALELKGKRAGTQQELVRVQAQLKDSVDDQARLRASVRDLPETAPAYQRYLEKFDKQETEIEELAPGADQTASGGRAAVADGVRKLPGRPYGGVGGRWTVSPSDGTSGLQ